MSAREWLERRMVGVALTASERAQRSKALAKEIGAARVAEVAERERAKKARAKIQETRARIDALAEVVASGEEPREMSVRCVADSVRGVLEVYHPDSGELLGSAPLEAAQLALDGSETPVRSEASDG